MAKKKPKPTPPRPPGQTPRDRAGVAYRLRERFNKRRGKRVKVVEVVKLSKGKVVGRAARKVSSWGPLTGRRRSDGFLYPYLLEVADLLWPMLRSGPKMVKVSLWGVLERKPRRIDAVTRLSRSARTLEFRGGEGQKQEFLAQVMIHHVLGHTRALGGQVHSGPGANAKNTKYAKRDKGKPFFAARWIRAYVLG